MDSFKFCPYSTFLCDGCMEFCDTPPSNNDCHICGPPDKPYVYCWLCVTPISIIIDYISCPCRYLTYINQKKNITIQDL